MKRRSEWCPSKDGPWPFVHAGGDLESSEKEWLHTNGAGAYAMSTIAMMHTRRYHAALVAALDPPLGRHVILSHAETTVNVEADRRTYRLATHQFPNVAPTPGYRLIESFAVDPIPRWTFRLGSSTLERTLCLVRGKNAVVIAYTWNGRVPARIAVRPLMPMRAVDALVTEHGAMMQIVTLRVGSVALQPVPTLPAVHFGHEGVFMGSPDWWRRFEYLDDRRDGLEFQEDMWTPGVFEFSLDPGRTAYLTVGVGDLPSGAPADLVNETREAMRLQDPGPSRPPAVRVLSIAAEDFCLSALERPLIIAGYPWHTLFTRDLVMSIPGLLLARDRIELAKKTLQTALSELRYGLLPEKLSGKTRERPHPAPDATLWVFEVARELLQRVGKGDAFLRDEVFPALVRIFMRVRSKRHRWIWMSPDGLITASEPTLALTWMDATIQGKPVTPRQGSPVELQALWTSGCDTLAELAEHYGHQRLGKLAKSSAERSRAAFKARFWCADTDYPYDCVSEGRDFADAWNDPSIRPNALLALSLDPKLFEEWQARCVLERVDAELLTPHGLRSLSPQDRRYAGHFSGESEEREGAYHQGSVWPHLLGAYVRACLGLYDEDDQKRVRLSEYLEKTLDAGVLLGQVGQLADGDPPYRPRGAPAQATSVAELLRGLSALNESLMVAQESAGTRSA